MKRFVISVLVVTLLSGCNPWTTIDKNMQTLRGEHISVLFATLGMPTNQGEVAGRKFYIWSTGGSVYMPNVETTTGYGSVGSQPFNYSQTTYGGGSFAQLHCNLRVFVDKSDTIITYDGSGNNGACDVFADRLSANPQPSNAAIGIIDKEIRAK